MNTRNYYLVVLFFVSSPFLYAQTTTSSDSVLTKKLEELSNRLNEVSKKLEAASAHNKPVIGTLELRKFETEVCSPNDSSPCKKIKIDRVEVSVMEGIINDVKVITVDKHCFTNRQVPIELNKLNERDAHLICKGYKEWKGLSIKINELLLYSNSKGLLVSDTFLVLTQEHPLVNFYKPVHLNAVLNVRTFTDLGGLSGKINSVAQIEGNLIVPLHHTNLRRTSVYLFHNLKMSAGVGWFDSKYKALPLDVDYNRGKLLQRSNFNIEGRANLMEYAFKKSHSWLGLDVLGGAYKTNGVDSSGTLPYTLSYVGFKPYANLFLSKSFSIYFSYRFMRQWSNLDKKYLDNGGKSFSIPEMEFAFTPHGFSGTRLFLRFRYFKEMTTSFSFMQAQIGYNIYLSELVNRK